MEDKEKSQESIKMLVTDFKIDNQNMFHVMFNKIKKQKEVYIYNSKNGLMIN